MFEHSDFLDAIRNVRSSSRLLCSGFQRDLSALLDGELADKHAQRALAHLESCHHCAEFFQAIRLQALAHKDLAVPGSLARRLRRMRGEDLFEGMTDSEILRRLAAAFYQLGKAYVLLATDGEYLLHVAEEPVEIDHFEKTEVAEAAEAARESGVYRVSVEDLKENAHTHLIRGRKLLDEALSLKPRFAEARLYLGFVCQVQGDHQQAAEAYREVFLRTDRLRNRAHAAIQLGLIYAGQNDHRRALRMFRWVVASGLVARCPEFAFVLHNILVEHVNLGNARAAGEMLRRLRADYPELWESVCQWMHRSPDFLSRVQGDADCRREFEAVEPAFFAASA
ncbi:MAG: hypothetical protein DWQ01_11335 [Planctomycetota bacterium]|nr:MAG: hypothetical protein DWQ01_11335 [Planctomycetota bacterium]